MATNIICDHADHLNSGNPTTAVARVIAFKQESTGSSTWRHVGAKDACVEHMGYFVESVYALHRKDPLLAEVRVLLYGKSDKIKRPRLMASAKDTVSALLDYTPDKWVIWTKMNEPVETDEGLNAWSIEAPSIDLAIKKAGLQHRRVFPGKSFRFTLAALVDEDCPIATTEAL